MGSDWWNNLAAVVATQNAISNFDFTLVQDDESNITPGESEVYVLETLDPFPDAIAVTSTFYEDICGGPGPCCVDCDVSNVIEVDIIVVLNTAGGPVNWVAGAPVNLVGTDDLDRNATNERLVLSHELLHAIGLIHDSDGIQESRLSPIYPFSGWFSDGVVAPLAHDYEDIRALYGGSSSGSSQMYANNIQGLTNGVGAPLSWDGSNEAAFPRNQTSGTSNVARRGDSVGFRVCGGNRASSTTSNVLLMVRLSLDATYSTTDLLIGSWTFPSFPAHTSGCWTFSFFVPMAVPFGTYNLMFRWGPSTGSNLSSRTSIINRPLIVVM